jgi:hypothetical protein
MSSTTQERLLRFFREAAGTNASETPAAAYAAESSGAPLAETASGAALGPMSDAGGGLGYAATPVGTSTEGSAETGQSTGGTGSTIESALTTFLEGGLGIVPLVSGLMGLFDGGSSASPQLEKFQKPSSIDFVSADTPNGLAAADYDQLGMPRLADTVLPTASEASPSGASGSSAGGTGSSAGASATPMPQMTLNIQAMDAQSILDRSGDIAQAVRNAMLNMSSINDAISDL